MSLTEDMTGPRTRCRFLNPSPDQGGGGARNRSQQSEADAFARLPALPAQNRRPRLSATAFFARPRPEGNPCRSDCPRGDGPPLRRLGVPAEPIPASRPRLRPSAPPLGSGNASIDECDNQEVGPGGLLPIIRPGNPTFELDGAVRPSHAGRHWPEEIHVGLHVFQMHNAIISWCR